MDRRRRFIPTPERPLVTWQPSLPGGGFGVPVPLNPIHALEQIGECPDALTLAERDHYDGIGGLGRFLGEQSVRDAARPGAPVGELGFWQLLWPAAQWVGGKVAEAAASAVLSLGFDKLTGEDSKLGCGPLADGQQASAVATYDRDLSAGLPAAALSGMVGELGAVNALSRVMGWLKRGGEAISRGVNAADNVVQGARRGVEAAGKGVAIARDVVSTAGQLRQVVEKMKDNSRRESITPGEVISLIKGLVSHANQLLGEVTGQAPGETRLLAELAGMGYALSSVNELQRNRGVRRRLDWRPTAGEYALGCCGRLANDPAMVRLRQAMEHGVFDVANNPHAAALRAQHARGIPDAANLNDQQLGALGETSDFFQTLAQAATSVFKELTTNPVGRSVIDGARDVVQSLVGSTEKAQKYQERTTSADDYLRELEQERLKIEAARNNTGSIPARAGYDSGLDKIASEQERTRALREEMAAELEKLKAQIAEDRKRMAPVAQLVSQQREKAKEAETLRLNQVEEMSDRNLLRGRVQVLSINEYNELLRKVHEGAAANDKLRTQAETLSRQYEDAGKKLADYGVQIVELRRQLEEMTRAHGDLQRERDTEARVELERRRLEDHLQSVSRRYSDELLRMQQFTDSAIEQAGDVVGRNGTRMAFDLLRQIMGAMREVRDVSQTGEFLTLFPRVLEQLRLAQQIATPHDPVVNVNVPPFPAFPQQPAPVVNVPRTEPPTFIISPTLDVRPATSTSTPNTVPATPVFSTAPA